MQIYSFKTRFIKPPLYTLTLFFSCLSLALISGVTSRVITSEPLKNSILISDGVNGVSENEFLTLKPLKDDCDPACYHVYGFLPCADNVGGYLFQVFSFGCLLIIGDFFLSQGRSKLFMVFEVGFYGGIIFPLLTMFPRIALMITPGLTANRTGANIIVGNNVGVIIGHTVFALTMQWGACVVFGMTSPNSDQTPRRGPVRRTTSDTTSPRRGSTRMRIMRNIVEASVEADPKNKKAAGIMLLSLSPFVIVTLPDLFGAQSWSSLSVLIALIISCSATIGFFVYSYFDTTDQMKSLEHARFELTSEVHKHLQSISPQTLIRDGQLSKESLKSLFDKIDRNKDGKIQISELKELTVEFGIFGRVKCDVNEFANTLLAEFDKDKSGELDENEFGEGIMKLLHQYKLDNIESPRAKDHQLLEEAAVLQLELPKQTLFDKFFCMRTLRAVTKLTGGMLILCFLAKPFMMNIGLLSVSSGVPSFYAVFAVIPLIRNLKNTLSAHYCRRKDKAKIASDKFCEIYKDVTINNFMGMSITLAIVYTKDLAWNHSIESVLAVVIVLIIGLPAYVRSSYPFWIAVLAFAMYFFSLVLIYIQYHIRGKT